MQKCLKKNRSSSTEDEEVWMMMERKNKTKESFPPPLSLPLSRKQENLRERE